MEILDISIFRGKNIYSHKTVIKMIVDIGAYGEIPTNQIEGFHDKLLNAFPGLKTNCCGLGYEGGFLERLNTGTYLAHVLEHVVLEIQYMLGYNVTYGKTRAIEEPSKYYLVYEYQNEICALECGKAAVFIFNCFLNDEEIDTNEFIDYLKEVAINAELGPSTAAIVAEAEKRAIPVTRLFHESLICLGYGKYRRVLESTLTDATSCISADIATNKQLTKSILNDHKIPVPYGKVVFSELSAIMAANDIGVPVVIKPYDGNQGKGVHLNLTNEDDIKSAFKEASSYSRAVIVEQYITGKDYRVLVVGDHVRAVSERKAACVIGDGINNISQLIDIVNLDENRGEHHEKPLTKIKLDAVALNILKKNNITPDYIPQAGEKVILRENRNLSTGGTAEDCTDIIDAENAEMAVRAAAAIGIDVAGIDFVTEDISQPISKSGGAIVEVNTAPGIRMHLYPSEGKPRNVAKDIVDWLYPDDKVLDFPIVSVTGTNGKTTTTRLISHVLECAGRKVGMTSTSGIYVKGKCVCKGDNTGPISAKVVLSNKAIDAAVLETARGGIIRAGLGYDLADVGIITNITADHLGLSDIHTLEDMAFVKSLVVEAIKENGTAVLNADDTMTSLILKRVNAKTILFTRNIDKAKNQFSGKDFSYVYAKNGFINVDNGTQQFCVVKIDDIPITEKGMIECNVENCLAAVSALYALNIPLNTIASGLIDFTDNKGRFNKFDMRDYTVMVDYAHNPAGYNQVVKSLSTVNAKRLVAIIGMPGDRENSAIEAVAEICAKAFDKIYIKEDHDLRGRQKGEVTHLLYHTIIRNGFPRIDVTMVHEELEALKIAMKTAEKNDLIVVLYENYDPLSAYLNEEQDRVMKNEKPKELMNAPL